MSDAHEELQKANDTVNVGGELQLGVPTVTGSVLTTAEVAKKRGWQTLFQSLGTDLLVALVLAVITVAGPWQEWGQVQWSILGFAVAKSLVQAAAAWVIRRWGDKSTGVVVDSK